MRTQGYAMALMFKWARPSSQHNTVNTSFYVNMCSKSLLILYAFIIEKNSQTVRKLSYFSQNIAWNEADPQGRHTALLSEHVA